MPSANDFDSDAMLVFMDEMIKRAEKLRAATTGMGEAGTRHMKNAGEATVGLGKSIDAVSKSLLGPVGLAAGFYTVAKALGEMATGRMQLELIAQNARLSAQNVVTFRGAMERAGATTAQAAQTLGGLTNALNDVAAGKWGSDIYKAISNMPNGKPWADAILADMQRGDMKAAIKEVVELFKSSSAEAQFRLGQIFGVDPALMTKFSEFIGQVKRKLDEDTADRKQYAKDWNDFWDDWANTVETAGGKAFRAYGKWREQWMKMYTPEEWKKEHPGEEIPLPPLSRTDEAEVEKQRQKAQEDADRLKKVQPFNWRNLFKRSSYDDGGTIEMSARMHDATNPLKGLADTEQDSNRLLRDIRDLLQGNSPTGSSGGTGYAAGQGRRAILEGRGGGSYGTGYQTRADRNNNPGNIKFGEFAKSQGATGADDRGFAVFPDREAGFKAAENLLGGQGYAGMTLGEIGNKWAAGDANWAQTVSKATGIPVGAVPTAEQRSQIARTGIPAAEGSMYGRGGGAVPADVLETAKKFALSGGPGAVFKFIRSQGYSVDSAWCGDFAAATIKAAGGTPPANPQIASNWRNYGQEVGEPKPGDIAVQRGAQTGATGSHVTIVGAVGRGQFTGIGGNQGRPESQYATDRYQFFRSAIDKQMAAKSSWEGAASIEVDFKNVPRGVRTGAEAENFKTLKVNRAPQNNDSTWAYD